MSNFQDFLDEQLQDPKFKAEYDALDMVLKSSDVGISGVHFNITNKRTMSVTGKIKKHFWWISGKRNKEIDGGSR